MMVKNLPLLPSGKVAYCLHKYLQGQFLFHKLAILLAMPLSACSWSHGFALQHCVLLSVCATSDHLIFRRSA
jgi:hypothetical protein